jgi:hypothetical protein
VGGAILSGLAAVMPLFQAQPALLAYPPLRRLFFGVSAHAAEVYPARVAGLSEDAWQPLAGALLAGAAAAEEAEADAAAPALEGLAALCRLQAEARGVGAAGMGPSRGRDDPNTPDSLLPSAQAALLRRLLLSRGDDPLRDAVADALLPAILAAPACWAALRLQLLAQLRGAGDEAGAAAAQRADAALTALTAANGLTAQLDRPNRRRFRLNVAAFATEVRGLMPHA